MSVLVGIDGSKVASAALDFAADEARLRGARLVAVHAGAEQAPSRGEVESSAEAVRREAIARVAAAHPYLDCRVVVRDADPAALLVELSQTADLLVVGTHRTGRLRGWVLGSVSQFVAAHAACPVVTISGRPENDSGPIVLGASTSPGGLAALRFACEEARLSGAPVRAVRSITTEDWALAGLGDGIVVGFEVMHDAAQAVLDKVLGVAAESLSGRLDQRRGEQRQPLQRPTPSSRRRLAAGDRFAAQPAGRAAAPGPGGGVAAAPVHLPARRRRLPREVTHHALGLPRYGRGVARDGARLAAVRRDRRGCRHRVRAGCPAPAG
jgi:nucleotide-binding universal stress UspA family protein